MFECISHCRRTFAWLGSSSRNLSRNFRAALLSRSPSRVERRRLVKVDPSAAVAGKNAHVGFSERRLGEAGRVSRASTTGGCCSLLRSHRLGIGVKLGVASQGTVYIVGKIPSCYSGGMRPMERRPSHFVPPAYLRGTQAASPMRSGGYGTGSFTLPFLLPSFLKVQWQHSGTVGPHSPTGDLSSSTRMRAGDAGGSR